MIKPLIYTLLFLFSIVSVPFGYIDDTDETYGYWEPIHYLLERKGMQTWEYSPDYAIRSYAFIYPFYIIAFVLKFLKFNKLQIFFAIKLLLSSLNGFALVSLVKSLDKLYSKNVIYAISALLLFSPGIYISGNALLPSSVCMILTSFAVASLINKHYLSTILLGCVAVLWTGWPFVGVIYLPLGIIILIISYKNHGVISIFSIMARGIICLISIAFLSSMIDIYMYRKWTSPTLNILLYNASGNGDNLYGIESSSYYIRNLFLNLGLSWPFTIASIILSIRYYLYNYFSISLLNDNILTKVGIYSSCFLWLGLLFSRPHKEERFMYPIYPLIIIIGGVSIFDFLIIISNILYNIYFNINSIKISIKDIPSNSANNMNTTTTTKSSDTTLRNRKIKNSPASNEINTDNASDNIDFKSRMTLFLIIIICLINAFLGLMRLTSNYVNYSGYMLLWKRSNDYIPWQSHNKETIICVGSDWHQFPSHFYLSSDVSLGYIQDGFTGQLPQYYHTINGTYIQPKYNFNDLNKEEVSRYINITKCNYFITSNEISRHNKNSNIILKELLYSNILDINLSNSSIARAYYIPYYSYYKNKYKKYILYQVIQNKSDRI